MVTKVHIGIKILIMIALLGVLSFYFLFNPSDFSFFPKCPFHSLTGLYCPGCGSQRAMHQFLHGHFLEGLRHNVLILVLILVLGYELIFNYWFKSADNSTKNILHNPTTTYAILVLVILYWIFRNIPIYPFTLLAPG